VDQLRNTIQTHVPERLYKSDEITEELSKLADVAVVEPSFALYFAVAGWFVKWVLFTKFLLFHISRKDKTLYCKSCIKNVNPADYANAVMDPLKLHHEYCPLLEAYPQWKLALEEYVYSQSNVSLKF
jgi:hypothetical protein